MIFSGAAYHVPMLPSQWEQKDESCSHGDCIGVCRMIFLDCCVIVEVNLVDVPSAGLVDTRGEEGNRDHSHKGRQ